MNTSPPASAAAIAAGTINLETLFPFELDEFQKQAIAALDAGKSVVVCAPTGSRKTLVGEYAIYRALARRRRVFYTTPLKALSNQKLRDFREKFGAENVGLLTGDLSVNRNAAIVVMTTEVFRNMLYGTAIGQVGISLHAVEAVVLDECHYMNDRQRGTVWEESIIYAPPEIQLVGLSATVANSEQLTDWISQVHGPTELIYSDYRPVPLEYYHCNGKGLFPLLNDKGTGLNPRLRQRRKQREKQNPPPIAFVVGQLIQRQMLPAIYFIFSRRGCDKAVASMAQQTLVSAEEAASLKWQIDEFLAQNPDIGHSETVDALYRGIAAHHAGILPAWKGLVEQLFQQGLIKVVFATETLAAGINMPARSTVISSLSKRTDRGHRLLNGSEFLQMAGRAGRRGMDEVGYAITVQTRFEGPGEASYLITSGPDPLVSQFNPSYGMVLNLLQIHTLEEARDLVERSFGQYLATLHLAPQQKAIANLEQDLNHHLDQLSQVEDFDVLADFEKLKGRAKEERRLLKTLQQQAREVRAKEISIAMQDVPLGTVLALRGVHVNGPQGKALPAVLAMRLPSPGQAPYLLALTQDNRWYVITVKDVVGLYNELPLMSVITSVEPPADLLVKPGKFEPGDETAQAVAAQIPDVPEDPIPPEVQAQAAQIAEVEERLINHQAQLWGNPGKLLKRQQRVAKIEAEISDRQQKLSQRVHHYWQDFLSLISILRHFDCLDKVEPTPLGEAAAAIRGDNELWLGLALMSGEFDDLAPHHLAGACAALVTENMRPDTWIKYSASSDTESALNGLRNLRRQIFQVQRRRHVALPVWLEYEIVGLVEQWVLETEWNELCANTSLDEGDIVRILRRTMDLLSQLPHMPHLPRSVKKSASWAIKLMNRAPIEESKGAGGAAVVEESEDAVDENAVDNDALDDGTIDDNAIENALDDDEDV
ncbi:MAG: DEAD/DEAH box helicase [Elainellaceae cyanobacterium]